LSCFCDFIYLHLSFLCIQFIIYMLCGVMFCFSDHTLCLFAISLLLVSKWSVPDQKLNTRSSVFARYLTVLLPPSEADARSTQDILSISHVSSAKRCNRYRSVCPSVSLSRRCGIISTKEDLRRCGFHETVVQRDSFRRCKHVVEIRKVSP